MCGIAGILNLNGQPPVPGVLKAMTDVIAHRGPDGEGQWREGPVGLGHRRLAILDLSDAASQPMQTEDGTIVLTYNGEVYNFEELRTSLKSLGYRFRSTGDTEVVLNAYHAWGADCVRRFNGMFAFAIWDTRKQGLFLARDRYGVKPLYYMWAGDTFLFASEIKALLEHPAVTPRVNRHVLLEYFTFQNVLTDGTLFDNVKMLPAGHTATLRRRGPAELHIDQYWDFDFKEPDQPCDIQEYEQELLRLFTQAVRRQVVSDAPVGTYLSGGIDSGAITAVAAQQVPNLTTFTGGFDLSSASGLELGFDERERAEALSYRFKTEHYEVVMKAGDMERVFPDLIWHLEDLRVGQCYPNYYVSRLASKFVKVALAGTGGDELFAGYPWRYYRTACNDGFEDYVQKYYKYWQRLVPNKVIHQLFQPDIWNSVRQTQTIDCFRGVIGNKAEAPRSPQEYINRSLYFESKTFLHGLLLVEDKLAMAHGLESRVPFLDNDLVDFATRVPVRAKLRDLDQVIRINENEPGPKRGLYLDKTNDGKIIMRNALSQFLPKGYANGVKQGFSAPDASWFRGESMDYVQGLVMDDGARMYEYLSPEAVRGLVGQHLSGQQNRRLFIWSLLSFEWWLRTFIR